MKQELALPRASGAGASLRRELWDEHSLAVYSVPGTLGHFVCVITFSSPCEVGLISPFSKGGTEDQRGYMLA